MSVVNAALLSFGMSGRLFHAPFIQHHPGFTMAGCWERSKVDDYFDILLIYGDKRVHVKGGYFYKQPVPEYTLFGKLGCFHKTRSDVQEAQLDEEMAPSDGDYGKEPDGAAGQLYTGGVNQTASQEIVSPRGNYSEFYAGVYESIANNKREPVTADDGVRVMQIIDASMWSHSEGKVVRLEPAC